MIYKISFITLALAALLLAGCQCGPMNPSNAYGSAANPSNACNTANANNQTFGVLNDGCGPCEPAQVPIQSMFQAAPPCPMPVTAPPCPMPTAAPAPCGQQQAFGVDARTKCGPMPAEALPGDTWCCVFVQPPAAAPVRVCVKPECQVAIPVAAVMAQRSKQVLCAPARTEWQQVDCEGGGNDCWKLVEIPAQYRTENYEECVTPASVRYESVPPVFKMQASAPPPGYWQWQKKDCNVPTFSAPMAGN